MAYAMGSGLTLQREENTTWPITRKMESTTRRKRTQGMQVGVEEEEDLHHRTVGAGLETEAQEGPPCINRTHQSLIRKKKMVDMEADKVNAIDG